MATTPSRTAHVGDDADLLPTLTLALADPDVTEVVLEPGRYVEQVVIGPRAAPLVVRSSTGRAEDVVLTWGLWQGARGRDGMQLVQRGIHSFRPANNIHLSVQLAPLWGLS